MTALNDNQKRVIEEIIKQHKRNDCKFNWTFFDKSFKTEKDSKSFYHTFLLENLYIQGSVYKTSLTDKGREFESFETEIKNKGQLEKLEKLLNLNLTIKGWQVNTRGISFLFSFVAIIISIAPYFNADNKQQDSQQVLKEIQEIRENLLILDSLIRQDTLAKINTELL